MSLRNVTLTYDAHISYFCLSKITHKYLIFKYLYLNLIALERPCGDGKFLKYRIMNFECPTPKYPFVIQPSLTKYVIWTHNNLNGTLN